MKRFLSVLLLISLLLCLPACGGSTPAADETLLAEEETASVSALRRYIVTFDPNGGELEDGSLTQHVSTGTIPVAPKLTRFGYELSGWEPELSEVSENTTFTAQWTAVSLDPEELYSYIAPSVGEIVIYDTDGEEIALGSGFFIDDEGTMLTNYHVMEGAYSADVTTSDGVKHNIESVLAYDTSIDLAMLRVDIEENSFLKLSDEQVRTGETVYAIGSSLGLTSTFSDGIVSTASRDYDGVSYIQTTAPISHGNSGGPLVNTHGWVVGINTMTMTEGQNLNFALDISEVDNLDLSNPLTVSEFYEETAPEEVSDQSGAFYDETDYAEVESNDSLTQADILYLNEWFAGDVKDEEDFDYYAINIEEPGDYLIELVPYYTVDSEYLICGLCRVTEDDYEIIDMLSPSEDYEYEVENVLKIAIEDADLYFIIVTIEDGYPYSDPAYYKLRVSAE